MSPRTRRNLLVVAAILLPAFVLADPPKKGSTLNKRVSKKTTIDVDALRKQYPYESLAPRLEYESRARRMANAGTQSRDSAKVPLTPDSALRLKNSEADVDTQASVRSRSIEMLHSANVEKFVASQGFGFSRMIRFDPSPDFLEYVEPEPVPLASLPAPSSAEQTTEIPVQLPRTDFTDLPGGAWNPSLATLQDFHLTDIQFFANPWSFGHVRDRDHVAGFRSHGFSGVPELGHPRNEYKDGKETLPARWRVARLELVSLLKHERPAVYLSEYLPRMSELKDAKTRATSPFETTALQKLRSGEDLVTTATTNEIQMLGSLRASKTCLQCHDAKRAELLGAFSYTLRRDPPLPAETAKPAS